jgi:hypothetical protein
VSVTGGTFTANKTDATTVTVSKSSDYDSNANQIAIGGYALLSYWGSLDVFFPDTVNSASPADNNYGGFKGDYILRYAAGDGTDYNHSNPKNTERETRSRVTYGIWRCMGVANGKDEGDTGDGKRNTLWQRIS